MRTKENQTWMLDTKVENYSTKTCSNHQCHCQSLKPSDTKPKTWKCPILIHLLHDPFQGILAPQDKDLNKTISDMAGDTPKCIQPSQNKNLNIHSRLFVQESPITPSFQSYDTIQIGTMDVDIDGPYWSCVQREKLGIWKNKKCSHTRSSLSPWSMLVKNFYFLVP